jgi:hypothetical protein
MSSKGWAWLAQSSRNAQRMTIDDDDDDVFPKKKEGKKPMPGILPPRLILRLGGHTILQRDYSRMHGVIGASASNFHTLEMAAGGHELKRKARDVLSRRQIRGKICVAIDVGSRAESS